MNLVEILNKSEIDMENSQAAGQVGQARSQLLKEEDLEFQSPFTERGLYTQQQYDSDDSDLSVVFDNLDALMQQQPSAKEKSVKSSKARSQHGATDLSDIVIIPKSKVSSRYLEMFKSDGKLSVDGRTEK